MILLNLLLITKKVKKSKKKIPKFQLNGKYFGTFSSNISSLKRKNAYFIGILDLFINFVIPFYSIKDYKTP